MKCTSCCSELRPGAKFCSKCGTVVGATTPPRVAQQRPPAAGASRSGGGRTIVVAALAFVAVLILGVGVYFFLPGSGWGSSPQAAATTGAPSGAQAAAPTPVQGSSPVAIVQPAKAVASPTIAASPTPAPSPTPSKPVLGTGVVKAPSPDKLMDTKSWGKIPINQMGLVMKDGLKKSDAEAVAKTLGGTIVGELSFINLYQLEIPASTEADLQNALTKARAIGGVDLAFPNERVDVAADIKGAPCSPLSDPVYGGTNGRPYQMIGVQSAWDILRATGVTLNGVNVGVADTGLYKGNDEFGGSTKVDAPEADDQVAQPQAGPDGKPLPYGTHATAVTGIIGANGENGGMTGVASPLGNKLDISVTNVLGGKYGGYTAAPADPNDPTKYVYAGSTFSIGPLIAIKELIEKKNVTVINCSWNTSIGADGIQESDPATAAAYRKFFEKMARDHPKVLFVVSAGNSGKQINGSKHYPAGLNLPNMITVGCLENDGSRIGYSNQASGNFEVTMAAPGHRVVSGVSSDGRVSNVNGGTSFATPQVTAAAAILRSINPSLSAADLKRILTQSASGDTDVSGTKKAIDASVGGKVLRVDNAVLTLLKEMKKVPADATVESLLKMGTISAVASSTKPKEYTIKATVGAVPAGGTDVRIELWGEGSIGGDTTKHLDAAGDVTWSLTILDEKSKPGARITRLDNRACVTLQLAPIDLSGTWKGTTTITDVQVNTETIEIPDPFDETKPPTVITKEECEKSVRKSLGEKNEMTMIFKPESSETGTVGMASAQKMPDLRYYLAGDWLTIDYQQKGWNAHYEGQLTEEDKEYKLNGTFRFWLGDGQAILVDAKGVWTVTKPKEEQSPAPAGGAPAKTP